MPTPNLASISVSGEQYGRLCTSLKAKTSHREFDLRYMKFSSLILHSENSCCKDDHVFFIISDDRVSKGQQG